MMVDGVAGGGIAIETIMERLQANGTQPDVAQIPAWIERYGTWYRDFQRALFHNPEKAALVLVAPAAGETRCFVAFRPGFIRASGTKTWLGVGGVFLVRD
jgi:hypothetical protein